MQTLEQHEVYVLSRNKAWAEYNKAKLEFQEMTEIYNHTFIRDKYVEQMMEELQQDIEMWNFIFTTLEKMLPHDPNTLYHG